MKKLIFLTLTLSLLCCGHKASQKETYKAAKTTKQKNAEEQFRLGNNYYKNRDYVKAAEYYRKAAEYGIPQAQNNLGVMHSIGKGVTRNYIEATYWLCKAAEQKYTNAQVLLGIMYEEGKGVPKDYVQAYKWLNIASAQGNNESSDLLDELEKEMTSEQIAKAQKESQEFKVKH